MATLSVADAERVRREKAYGLKPLFRGDVQTIVGSVLLAVGFSATMQITERIDAAITGGIGAPFGVGGAFLWWSLSAIFFGMTGALIAANFNPIIAVLTATHPIAWSFFFINMAIIIPAVFLFRWRIQQGRPLTMGWFIITWLIGWIVGSSTWWAGLYPIVLKLSLNSILFWMAIQTAVVFPSAIAAWFVYLAVYRSRVLG